MQMNLNRFKEINLLRQEFHLLYFIPFYELITSDQ